MAKEPKKSQIGKFLIDLILVATFLSLLTPLILSADFFFPFVGPKSLYFMALAEIIFFSWLILIFIEPKYRPKFNLVLFSLVVYLFVLILASIFGVNPSYSFWSKHERMTGVLMHLHLFGFFLVLSSVFEKEDFEKFFLASVFVAILAALYALVNLKNPTMRGGGTIGNESFLGTYLLFNLFFALYLIFETKDFLKRFSIFSFLILAFSICAIGVNFEGLSFSQKISFFFFKSGARAAKISFFGGLVLLFFLWLIASEKKIFKIFGFLCLISSLLLAGYSFFSFFKPESFVKNLVEKEVGSFGGRFPVWRGAWEGFKERPILGWGPENFEFSFVKHFDPCLFLPECGGEIWFDRAHNIIFDTLISSGILGLISYLLIFGVLFFVLWKNFLKKRIDFWLASIFTSLFVSYFVQNLTVFDMISSYLMFFLSLSFVASLEKEIKSYEKQTSLHPLILTFVSLSFLICFTFFVILPTISSKSVILAIKAPPFSKKRILFEKRALSLSPLGKVQIRQFFAENFISAFYSTSTLSSQGAIEELEFLIEELKKSVKENPLDFRSLLRLGQHLNILANFDQKRIFEAQEILEKAIQVSPKNQQGYWTLAQNLISQGKFTEAIDLAQKALNLEPELETAHSVLIQILKLSGEIDLAKKKLEEAVKINPKWEESLSKILQ